MIFDHINQINRYNLPIQQILNFTQNNSFEKGKNLIDGEELFALGLEYQTKPEDELLWEAHRKYLDVHFIVSGSEYIYVSDIEQMQSTQPYQDDYELFSGSVQQKILMQEGDFLVLFPNEVHKTSILSTDESSQIQKYVFKIKLEKYWK